MVAIGKAIARASSGLRRPDRYELRMDFEHDLYSVAHADKDSLDLDFLTGKFLAEQDPDAGAKALTDLVTLTRTTTATYRDASGVLQTAAVDTPRRHYPAPRIVSAQGSLDVDFDNPAQWTLSGGASISGGVLDLQTTPTGSAVGASQVLLEEGRTYLVRARAAAGTQYGAEFVLGCNASGNGGTNLTKGRLGNFGDGATYAVYEFQVTLGPGEVNGQFFKLNSRNAGYVGLVDWFSIVELSHADGEESGLLLEPERFNRVRYSRDFTQSNWTVRSAGVPTQDLTGPNGQSNDGWTFTADGTGRVRLDQNQGLANTNPHVAHFIFRHVGVPYAFFRTSGLGADAGTYVDSRTGEVTSSPGAHEDVQVQLLNDGWMWLTLRFTPSDTSGTFLWGFSSSPNSESSPASGEQCGIWYAGCEEGDSPTMPIDTLDTGVTRARDTIDQDITNELWSPPPGSVLSMSVTFTGAYYASGSTPANTGSSTVVTVTSEDSLDGLLFFADRSGSDDDILLEARRDGVKVASARPLGVSGQKGLRQSAAARWGSGSASFRVGDYALVDSDAPPTSERLTKLRLGNNFHGLIHSFRFSPTLWSDEKLLQEATP